METILAIAAVGLLIIQAHRNYLIVKGYNKPNETAVKVEVDYEALANAMEASWPTVTVSNDVQIDYDKLAEAFNKQEPAIIQIQPTVVSPTVVPNPPTYPSPYWQSPVVSESEQGVSTATTEFEINGIPVKRYPAR